MAEFFSETKTINLISGDGEGFIINEKPARLSKLIETVIGPQEDMDPNENVEVSLTHVSSAVLPVIIQFLNHFDADSEENKEKVTNIPQVSLHTSTNQTNHTYYFFL